MGDQTSTSQSSSTAGAQSPEARRMMALLGQQVEAGANDPALRGEFNISAQQQGLVNDIQRSTGDVARAGMEQNLQAILRQLEDSNIGRQITGGSLEAVNQALVGQESLRNVDQLGMQQQGQAAQMALNVPFQAADAQNKALLARLVQPASTGLNYDQVIRGLNSTQYGEQTQPFDYTGAAMAAGKIGAAPFTGGASLGIPG